MKFISECKLFWTSSRLALIHTEVLFSSSQITSSQFITSDRTQRALRDRCASIPMPLLASRTRSSGVLAAELTGAERGTAYGWLGIEVYSCFELNANARRKTGTTAFALVTCTRAGSCILQRGQVPLRSYSLLKRSVPLSCVWDALRDSSICYAHLWRRGDVVVRRPHAVL